MNWNDIRLETILKKVDEFTEAWIAIAREDDTDKADYVLLESAAREAIEQLFGDAHQAYERRELGAFKSSIGTLQRTIEHSVDLLGSTQVQPFGLVAPLYVVRSELPTLRVAVYKNGMSEFVEALIGLDHWLVDKGTDRETDALFELGIEGFSHSHLLALRGSDSPLKSVLRARRWRFVGDAITLQMPESYQAHILSLQLDYLEHELQAGTPRDFKLTYNELQEILRLLPASAESVAERDSASALNRDLQRKNRIALMSVLGLGVVDRLEMGTERLQGYLDVGREVTGWSTLMEDLNASLIERSVISSRWRRWEMRDSVNFEVQWINPEVYPISFVALRSLELVETATPGVFFGSRTPHASQQLVATSQNLTDLVRATPDWSPKQRFDELQSILTQAVSAQEKRSREEIARLPILPERRDEFVAEVLAERVRNSTLERLWRDVGKWIYAEVNSSEPATSQISAYVPRAPFTATSNWAPISARTLPISLERSLGNELLANLHDLPTIPEDSAATVENDIAAAIKSSLAEIGGLPLVILAGDWNDLVIQLEVESPEGWRGTNSGEELQTFQVGWFDDAPVVMIRATDREIFVVDRSTWGTVLRAPVDGEDLHVSLEAITPEMAAEIIARESNMPNAEREEATNMLISVVSIAVSEKVGFHVKDASRALRVV